MLPGKIMGRLTGALIGAFHGMGRSFVLVTLLFVYVSLFPLAPFVSGIKDSPVYMQASFQAA